MRMFEAKNPFTTNSKKEKSMKKTNVKKTVNTKVEIAKPTKGKKTVTKVAAKTVKEPVDFKKERGHAKPMDVVKSFANSNFTKAVVDPVGYKKPSGLLWSLNRGIENCGLSDTIEVHTINKEVTLIKK